MKLTKATRLATATAVVTMAVSAAVVALGASSAFAAPPAATPNSGLTDLQVISISGQLAGVPTNTTVQIEECQGTAASPPLNNTKCDASSLDTQAHTTDASGTFTNAPGDPLGTTGFVVYTLGVPGSHFPNSTIRCDFSHACTLYVGQNQNAFAQPHVFVDISFAPPAPTVVAPASPTPQTLTVANLGTANITVNNGTQNDSNGVAETINPSSTTTGVAPAHGTVSNVSPGVFKYTNTDGTQATDSFTVSGATATCAGADAGACTPATSAAGNNILVNVTINGAVAFPNACDISTQPTCQLKQVVQVSANASDLTMAQAGDGTHPVVDVLGNTLSGSNCTAPAITLNGQPQFACGVMSPITVINGRGTPASWALTGQLVGDFLDGLAPVATTCDTVATYSADCIPGNNLGWTPAAAIGQGIVPGDVAHVVAGGAVAAPGVTAPVNVPGVLGGTCGAFPAAGGVGTYSSGACQIQSTTNYPVGEPSPAATGLHNQAQTLCNTTASHSGGTFVCGASLVLAVPASSAATNALGNAPYTATLVFTLA